MADSHGVPGNAPVPADVQRIGGVDVPFVGGLEHL